MKATIYVSVIATTGYARGKKNTIVKDVECNDLSQARGLASTISGVSFTEVKKSPMSVDNADYYQVKITDTTTYVLKVEK